MVSKALLMSIPAKFLFVLFIKGSSPFTEEPLENAFYYPTHTREIEFDDKKICLSPGMAAKNAVEGQNNNLQPIDFLAKSNTLLKDQIPTKDIGTMNQETSGSSKFDETWPSTEHTASPNIDTYSSSISQGTKGDDIENWLSQKHLTSNEEPKGTIARYIHRFRNEAPRSRQERDLESIVEAKGGEFWWVADPSNSSTPKESDSSFSPPVRLRDSWKLRRKPPKSPELRHSMSVKQTGSKANEFDSSTSFEKTGKESDTARIQNRAQRLIEMSENTLSSSSTEVPALPSQRQKSLHSEPRIATLPFSHSATEDKSSALPAPRPKPAPDDDILYQWRLARKMEKARQGGNAFQKLPFMNQDKGVASRLQGREKEVQQQQHDSEMDELVDTEKENSEIRNRGRDKERRSDIDGKANPIASITELDIKNFESRSGKQVTTTNTQTVSSYPNSFTGSNIDVEYSEIPSHMHAVCDILPCPHARTIAGDRSDITVDGEIYKRPVQCSRQAELLRNSCTENPLILSAPATGLDYDSVSGFDHARSDGKFRSKDRAITDRAAVKQLKNSRNFSSKSRTVDNATKCDKGISPNLAADCSQSEMNSSELLEAKHLRTKRSKKLSREKMSSLAKEESKEHGDLLNSSVNSSHHGIDDQENIKMAINQVISENLFLASISSEASGNTTDEQFEDISQTQTIENYPSVEDASKYTVDAENSDSEFPDDEILKLLRQRRKGYRKSLREIEEMLAAFPSEDRS
eukprot:Seg626.5 transcript_id=Seg626.5/GoldUCD/mRNA.D3Y31 product="Proline and serine-rich protein 3" protein_id=Seg626.5/GoldUCD/D3Y31